MATATHCAARLVALALALALAPLGCEGGRAPEALCFADVRRTGPRPSRPLGAALGLSAAELLGRIRTRGADGARGCALTLLEMPASLAAAEFRDLVDVGWAYRNESCLIPLAYRQYFGCAGGALPSPQTCAGFSETRLRGGYGTSDYALVGSGLLLRPGVYDRGTYVYVLGYGPDDVRVGSVALVVGSDPHKYPCGLDRGIGVSLHHKGRPTVPLSDGPADDWACGCFPEDSEDVGEAWAAVNASELGLASLEDYFNADDEGSAGSEERDPDLVDCRADGLFTESDMFRNASGPEALLIGAVAKDVLTAPLALPPGQSYEDLRRASRECNARAEAALLPLPVAARREGGDKDAELDFGIFGLPADPSVRRAVLIGLVLALLVLLVALVIVLACACRLARQVKAARRARAAAAFARNNAAYEAHV
ncbi:envelope glycoprotein G [Cervid alphaherpesvirus 2]|uniref:Envelope glycoprotein G n=1 Tax=Cervid alphaherpesvirus 2 TaxID=365327 RepID=A0A455JQ96_9ALPH|nr:envelope glycoprotein G [Cervid alphaherpesvirus 2]AVT50787.1 envelope glycoprotein G [Cervid alphaherpesvirus 2]